MASGCTGFRVDRGYGLRVLGLIVGFRMAGYLLGPAQTPRFVFRFVAESASVGDTKRGSQFWKGPLMISSLPRLFRGQGIMKAVEPGGVVGAAVRRNIRVLITIYPIP